MSRWDKFFLVVQRVSSLLVILFAGFAFAMAAWNWIEMRRYEGEFGGSDLQFGGDSYRKLPYGGEEIETAAGSLVTIFQHDDEGFERVEFGGITIANSASGKAIEIAPERGANVIQFELIFESGDDSKAIGYLATTATAAQYEQGRMDLVVGALPALTRSVAARGIRYSDLPQIRGDGSVGLLMWPEEDEAWLVAIRLEDGAITERAKVHLPVLKKSALSQGPGGDGATPFSATPANVYPKR